MIRLDGITIEFPYRGRVLDGLDLHLPEGTKLGLAGANGSGKTTLLHLIMGLMLPDSGSVRLFGKECGDEDAFKEARRRIGFVFQDADDQLFCPTVAEDVAFGPRNLGKSADEAHDIVHSTLDMLGIEHLEARVTHNLSGGEKRLVALATVMAMEPDLLILDEPTTGLDDATAERVIGILDEHVKTCLIVSHDKGFLASTVKEVVRLEGGRLA